jgi:ubiquitin carboxyl-terminal hydrolase 34
MQQFFCVIPLRNNILRINDNEKENLIETQYQKSQIKIDDNFFHQLQKLFSNLLISEKQFFNPFDFTYSFKDFEGNPTKIFEQKDAQEFLAIFLDRLENVGINNEYKYMINNIFGGRNCSLIECLSCHKIKMNFEPILYLSLEVKNMKTLKNSLEKYFSKEFIDGYECEGCKNKVKIEKRNILADLPNVLIIHLQRIFYNFEYDHNEKINSYLEFPRHLNLKPYTLEELNKTNNDNNDDIYFRADEYYNYYLVGVVVHVGSADSGHYYSYINTVRGGTGDVATYDETDNRMDSCWLEYNDSHISKFNIDNLERECFGGSTGERSMSIWGNADNCKNAYLLVYERKLKMPLKRMILEEHVWLHKTRKKID